MLNPRGVDYYHRLIDALKANDIEPMVTLYHWDLPQALEDVGGWLNESTVDHFQNYTDLCFKEYGDKVWFFNVLKSVFFNITKEYTIRYNIFAKMHHRSDSFNR